MSKTYRPLQSPKPLAHTGVLYLETPPNIHLTEIIHCYWQLKSTEYLNQPFEYRVVADACIDIFFSPNQPNESHIMGFCNTHTSFNLHPPFHYIGIRFLPGMFPALFKTDAQTLSHRFQNLNPVLQHTASFIANQFSEKQTFHHIVNQLNTHLSQKLHKQGLQLDPRFHKALKHIIQNQEQLPLSQQNQYALSQRQMRRHFEYYIGDTPKAFSQIIRFQNAYKNALEQTHWLKNKTYYDFGYYDQAHFSKAFKQYYGQPPTKALGK